MKSSVFLVIIWVMQWECDVHAQGWGGCCNCYAERFPRSCRGLTPKSVSGVYKIQPLPNIDPIEVYCEMAVGGGGFTFLPRSLSKTRGAQKIVNFLFRDRKEVLLKLQKKNDRSESYTLIQPHPNFTKYSFKLLVNSYSGYTKPKNHYMSDYFFLGIIPAAKARRRGTQGFKSNGRTIQFRNCDANPNSFFVFMPNHKLQTPSGYHPNLVYERSGVAVNWRSTAIPITNPDRMMPNQFFFLTELHFGGCGCFTPLPLEFANPELLQPLFLLACDFKRTL